MARSGKERPPAAERRREKLLEQARIYDSSGSFDEYRIKCAVRGVGRKSLMAGLVDPFWIYGKVRDIGLTKTALMFAAPLLFAGSAVNAVFAKTTGMSPNAAAVAGGAIGAAAWSACLYAVQNIARTAGAFLRDVRAEKFKI